jgi:toxin YoeB
VSAGPARSIVVVPAFLEDVRWWVATQPRVALRLLDLVEVVMRDPFRGIGKPEPLKNLGADTWSRRITQEHRLVYRIFGDRVEFLQARCHY